MTIGIVVCDTSFNIEEVVDFDPLKWMCCAPQQYNAIFAEELLPSIHIHVHVIQLSIIDSTISSAFAIQVRHWAFCVVLCYHLKMSN